MIGQLVSEEIVIKAILIFGQEFTIWIGIFDQQIHAQETV